MKKLTAKMMRRYSPCKEGLEDFTRFFPDGMEITKENIAIAYDAGLQIMWLMARYQDGKYDEIFTERRRQIHDSYSYIYENIQRSLADNNYRFTEWTKFDEMSLPYVLSEQAEVRLLCVEICMLMSESFNKDAL